MMFYFDGNNDNFEKLIKEYISISQDYDKNGGPALSYEIGKGWPNFTLDALEKATGLDGEEYGFNPDRAGTGLWDAPIVEARLPDFEAETLNVECDCTNKNHEYNGSLHYNQIYYKTDMFDTDMECMRKLSNEITVKIHPVICDIINDYDYEESPILCDSIDREFLVKLVDMAIDKAALTISEVKEIQFDTKIGSWDRYKLMRCVFEAVTLQEIFGCRRPNYRRVMGYK